MMGMPPAGIIIAVVVIGLAFAGTNKVSETAGWFRMTINGLMLFVFVMLGLVLALWVGSPLPHMETNQCQVLWNLLNPGSKIEMAPGYCTDTNIALMVKNAIKPISGVDWSVTVQTAINEDWQSRDDSFPRTKNVLAQYWSAYQKDEAERNQISWFLGVWVVIWFVIRSVLLLIRSGIQKVNVPVWIATVLACVLVFWGIFLSQYYAMLVDIIAAGLFALIAQIAVWVVNWLVTKSRYSEQAVIAFEPLPTGMWLLVAFAAFVLPALSAMVVNDPSLRMTNLVGGFIFAYIALDSIATFIQGLSHK